MLYQGHSNSATSGLSIKNSKSCGIMGVDVIHCSPLPVKTYMTQSEMFSNEVMSGNVYGAIFSMFGFEVIQNKLV